MNAKEAREQSEISYQNKIDNEYIDIQNDIQRQVNLGKFRYYYFGKISEGTISRLEKDGFTVAVVESAVGTCIDIRW
jgi:hypothetical protein